MKNAAGWGLMVIAGLILIIVGFQGRLGAAFASLITPGLLADVPDKG